jgi:phage repressor protein C with HTH and peptisase S24 domain
MEFDDRPDFAKRLEKARVARGFASAKAAAKYFGWKYDSYAQHESGLRGIGRAADKYAKAYRVSEGWLLTGEGPGPDAGRPVPIVGYVGAGAMVEEDFEQVPEGGLEEIEVPFPLPADMVAFEVRGDSMLPMYDPGAVLIVYKDQRKPLHDYYGRRVIVRTDDGRRYVKTIIKGDGDLVSLLSWNASTIENVAVTWIGEIFTVFPAEQVRKIGRRIDRQGGIQGHLAFKTA